MTLHSIDRSRCSVPWPKLALESLGVAIAAHLVIGALTSWSYRASPMVAWPPSARAHVDERVRAARRAAAHNEAGASLGGKLRAPGAKPLATDDDIPIPMLSVILGCIWLSIRLRGALRKRSEHERSARELLEWKVLPPRWHGADAAACQAAPLSTVCRTRPARRLVGGGPGSCQLDAPARWGTSHQPAEATATQGSRAGAGAGAGAGASEHEPAAELSTRIIYRVGGNLFRPDDSVLTAATLGQLRLVRDSLMLAPRHQVIRVVSDVASRYAKTQAAAQLAVLLSEKSAADVLVLEGDVDTPALHNALCFDAPAGLGLSEQLQGIDNHDIASTLSIIRVEGNFHALTESRTSIPSARCMVHFAEVIEQLRQQYGYIVIDGPVIDDWPDVPHLSTCIDGILLVTAAAAETDASRALAAKHFRREALLSVVTTGR